MKIFDLLISMPCQHVLNALFDKKIRANDLYLCSQFKSYLD